MNQTLNTRKIIQFAVVIFLLIALPVALLLSRQRQEIRKKAAGNAYLSLTNATPSVGSSVTATLGNIPAGTVFVYGKIILPSGVTAVGAPLKANNSVVALDSIKVNGSTYELYGGAHSAGASFSGNLFSVTFTIDAGATGVKNIQYQFIALNIEGATIRDTGLLSDATFTVAGPTEPANTIEVVEGVTPVVTSGTTTAYKVTVRVTGDPAPTTNFGGETPGTTCKLIRLIGARASAPANDIKNTLASADAVCLTQGQSYVHTFAADSNGQTMKMWATVHNDSVNMAGNYYTGEAWSQPISTTDLVVPALGEPANTIEVVEGVTPVVTSGTTTAYKVTVRVTGDPAPTTNFGGETPGTTCKLIRLIGARASAPANDIKNTLASADAVCLTQGQSYVHTFAADSNGQTMKMWATVHNDSVNMAGNYYTGEAWSQPISTTDLVVPALGEPANTIEVVEGVTPVVTSGTTTAYKVTVRVTGDPAPTTNFGGETPGTTCKLIRLIGARASAPANDIKNTLASADAVCLTQGQSYVHTFAADSNGQTMKMWATVHNDSVNMAGNYYTGEAWSQPISTTDLVVPALGEPANTIEVVEGVTPVVTSGTTTAYKVTVRVTGDPAPTTNFGGETPGTTCKLIRLIGARASAPANDIKNTLASADAVCLTQGQSYVHTFAADSNGQTMKMWATVHNDSVNMAGNYYTGEAWSQPISTTDLVVPALGEPANTITIGAVTQFAENGVTKYKVRVTLGANPTPAGNFGGDDDGDKWAKVISAPAAYNAEDVRSTLARNDTAIYIRQDLNSFDLVFTPDEIGQERRLWATFHNDAANMPNNFWPNQSWSRPISSESFTVSVVNLPSNTLWDSLLGGPSATYNGDYDLWPTVKDNRVDGFDYVRWLDLGGHY